MMMIIIFSNWQLLIKNLKFSVLNFKKKNKISNIILFFNILKVITVLQKKIRIKVFIHKFNFCLNKK